MSLKIGRVATGHKHDVLCKSVSEHARPPGPLQFAIKELLSHRGRKTKGADGRVFLVNFKGFFWKHEDLPASALPPQVICDYEEKRAKRTRRKRKQAGSSDPLQTLVNTRRRRILKHRLEPRPDSHVKLASPDCQPSLSLSTPPSAPLSMTPPTTDACTSIAVSSV